VIAVGGHESAHGAALPGLVGPGVASVACGRQLHRAVAAALRDEAERVCVVPMTVGRDVALIADTARTLRALPPDQRARVVLSEPFGTTGHLIGWLRAAASRVPVDAAALIVAPTGDAYDDAELFRVARLVWQYGRRRVVEVALIGGKPDPNEGVARCVALGATRVVTLSASFVAPDPPDAVPLLSVSAIAGVLRSRVHAAVERARSFADDGLAAALTAADHHGTAHSHADGHSHDHPQPRQDRHSHGHPHPHPDGGHDHARPAAGDLVHSNLQMSPSPVS
jgi:hypothetical protein